MTLLIVATVSSCSKVYDWNTKSINKQVIHDYLQSLTERYSLHLIDLISRMLTFHPMHRPAFQELEKELTPYAELID